MSALNYSKQNSWNEQLSILLLDWFSSRKKNEKEVSVISSSKLINVNKVQENLFKNYNYAYNEKMCLSYKISFNYITYFSSEYKKTT